ncbi:MAG: PAS domain S-box protein, partial [Ginsengibacter sp.]
AADMITRGADDYILKDRLNRLPAAIHNALEKFSREKGRTHMIYQHAHLAAIVNASADGIISKTLDGIITSWNISAEKLFGYSAAEAIGKKISIIIPTDRLKEESEFMESIKRGEFVQHFETVRLKKNGTRVDVSLTISPINDNNGKVIGAAKIVYDITERKQAEQILKDSEEKYHSFFENSTDGLILTEAGGRVLSANSAACTIFKMSEEEICKAGRFGLADITDPRMAAAIEECQRTGKVKAEITLIRGNGDRFPGELTSVVYKNAAGEQRTSMVVRDISEKKHTQKLLIESEQFNEGILASISSCIAVIDDKGNIIAVNKAWDDLTKSNWIDSSGEGSMGSSYIEVCQRALGFGDGIARQTLQGIQSVFNKEIKNFELEYPCHSLTDHRWFSLSVVNFHEDDSKVMISHQDITARKMAEEKLIQSEKQSRDLFDQSIIGLALARMDGTLVDVNEAYAKIIGRTIKETKKLTYLEITPGKYLEQENEILKELGNTGKFMNYEKEYIHKKGYLVPVRLSGNIIEKEGEKFIWSSVEDITEKKKLEKALENERNQFFEMFLKAPSAIGMLKGADHVFEMANPLYLQLIGKKDVTGKTVAEVLPEVVEQGFIDLLDNVYITGKPYTGTEILVKLDKEGDGELTDAYLNFIYQAYRNDEGNIEGIFFFANDITEQILSRKVIEKSEKFFKGVIESSDDMITILAPTGETIYASPAVAKKFGYTNEEWLNLNITDIVHPGDAVILQEFVGKIMMHPGVPMECPLIRERKKDGSYIWVEGTVTNFLETEGINAIVANFRDVTERKNAEEKLIQSEKHSRNLFEKTVIGLALARMDGTLADVNEAYAKIIGRTIEETLKLSYWEITPEKYHDQENKVLEELMDTGKFINYEKEYIHKEGHLVPVRLSGNIIERSGEKFIWSSVEDITDSKKAEAENVFKANLLNTIGQAAVALDINGIINYWNKAAEDIYGWTKEEAIGKNIIDLIPSEATIEQATQIMEELKKGNTWSGEFRSQKKDGTNFPALVTDSPIYDQHGKLTGIMGISSDITEKKALEELLDKTNRLAAIGSWEIDVDKGTVFWSDITKEIREVDKDFVPQLDIGISYFKEGSHKEIINQKVKECIENGTSWDEELEILTFKGNPKWVRTIGEGEFINGKCIRIYGSFQDIDARKKAEAEVLKVYEEKNIILESIGDGFYAIDKNWNFTYWNSKAEILLGKKREDVLGKNIWEIYPEAVDTLSYLNYHRAVKENAVQQYQRFNESLGMWVEITAYPSVNGLSVYFKDITDRKLAEERLHEINKSLQKSAKELAISNSELEQFAHVASHDLQEPLRTVTSFLTLIEKKYSDIIDDKGKQYIQFAVDGAKRMRQIILDLLEFSKIGQEEDKIERIDLNGLVNDIISLHSKQISENKAVIIAGKLPVLTISVPPIRQVFQNLISNSLKYHRDGIIPQITISAKDETMHWQFAVTDNGIGIRKEFLDKIFIIFQRLHGKEKYSGTGLGLAITKKIIENAGGKIWVESEEGVGSSFYFTIPKKN